MSPSCSGKSFFLSLLRENGFNSSQCITTRESRGTDELWHLISIKKKSFYELKDSKRLCFIAETFGNYYACMDFPYRSIDVAVLVRTENVEELRAMGGIVMYIRPFDNGYCEKLIKGKGRGNYQMRISELLAIPNIFEAVCPEVIFINRYDKESEENFLKMIQEKKRTN